MQSAPTLTKAKQEVWGAWLTQGAGPIRWDRFPDSSEGSLDIDVARQSAEAGEI